MDNERKVNGILFDKESDNFETHCKIEIFQFVKLFLNGGFLNFVVYFQQLWQINFKTYQSLNSSRYMDKKESKD